jgi:F-type H+-transporting ATPase subunit delta
VSVQSVAAKYAHALFDVARASNRVEPISRDLDAFSRLLVDHPELQRVLTRPSVPAARKRAAIDALLASAGALSPEVSRLLQLLADRDRLPILSALLAAFNARAQADARIVSADVVTAVPLDAASRDALARALSAATDQHVTIRERVDPAMIGGVIAQVGSRVFDGSVTRQLARMRQRLLAET